MFEEYDTMQIHKENVRWEKANNVIESEWVKRYGNQRLFELSSEDMQETLSYLNCNGLSDSDWFVVFHPRWSSDDLGRNSGDELRFEPAIKEIVNRGGWVIRLGVGYPPSKIRMERFIDYAGSGWRSENLDIGLIAKAKFLLGAASGPSDIAALFGTRVLRTNASQIGANVFRQGSLDIPTILVPFNEDIKESTIGFRKQLALGYLDVNHKPGGFEYRSNTPDEIQSAVCEMLENETEKSADQTEVERMIESRGYYPTTTVSAYFIRKHEQYFKM